MIGTASGARRRCSSSLQKRTQNSLQMLAVRHCYVCTCVLRQLTVYCPVFHWEKGGVAGRASGARKRCSSSLQKRVLPAARHLRHCVHT